MTKNQLDHSDFDILFKRLRDFAAGSGKDVPPSWAKFCKTHVSNCSLNYPACQGELHHFHHIFGSYVSRKTSGVFTIPVCANCHAEIERQPRQIDPLIAWCRIAHHFIKYMEMK